MFILGAGFSKQAGMPLATERLLSYAEFEGTTTRRPSRGSQVSTNASIGSIKPIMVPRPPEFEELFDLGHFDALIWRMALRVRSAATREIRRMPPVRQSKRGSAIWRMIFVM